MVFSVLGGGGLVDTVFSSCSPSSGDSGLKGVGVTHGQFLKLVLLSSPPSQGLSLS